MAFWQIASNYFANAGGAANESLAFTKNTTLGNLSFLVVGWESGVTITSVTSTLGETVHSQSTQQHDAIGARCPGAGSFHDPFRNPVRDTAVFIG